MTNKILKQNLAPLSLMLVIPFMHIFYEALNNANRGVYSLITDLDHVLPFLKVFIIPYVSWYFFIFFSLAYFCVKDRETYYKTLVTYFIGLVTCYLIYYFFQTTVPRPELTGGDIFTKIVSFIYSADEPYNAFPSIHSFASFIMIKAINQSPAKTKLNSFVIKTIAVSIILSTLFVKQHVVLDALSAILLGGVIFNLVNNFSGVSLPLWRKRLFLLSTTKKKLEI